MTAVMTDQKTRGRSLVSTALFARLVDRIVAEDGLQEDQAVRVMDQALAFLGACATSSERLVPSKQVDPGWHAFVLHTQEYALFCARIAGRFIHHDPTDPAEETSEATEGEAVARTISAIRAAGYIVDPELWGGDAAKCGETGCGAGRPPVTLA